MSTKPASIATPMAAAPPARRGGASAAPRRAWTLATPWLMGAVLLLAAYVAWFTFDLLHSGVFPEAVEDVRRQVLIAFSVIVAMLVLVVALAAQWVLVARRERDSRGRAEHLAAVAEAERARAETVARDKAPLPGHAQPRAAHAAAVHLEHDGRHRVARPRRGADPAFARLKESTRSLRGRISDLVDFAKMSSGRLETRIRGFQLDKLMDTALRDVEEALALRNLDVHWEAGPELGQRIYSDPARLRQVIDNLLTNAIKYTERGGISINAALRRDAGLLRIEISDTGVGIDPDEMSRLFEPFYRSPQTAGMAEGSGLGLAVVRSLVDLMGGTIRVDSRVGQGTAVTVEVPITEGVDGLADAPPRIDTRLPVLVVDDSRDARRAIADVIRALGIEVVEAVDGATGLAAAGRARLPGDLPRHADARPHRPRGGAPAAQAGRPPAEDVSRADLGLQRPGRRHGRERVRRPHRQAGEPQGSDGGAGPGRAGARLT